ncbi:hypothetical protein [Dialister invisus]|uniref:hypothetical protein n=1 Tax=Dialister invisus TaxID=218538 RepID=UPI0026DB3C5F|nr:hypothetical protein [Dialister invisus]
MRKTADETVTQSKESITLMASYRFPSFRALAKCFMRKAGISNMTQSEESVTLMTFYRLPSHGNRSFTFVQDDA